MSVSTSLWSVALLNILTVVLIGVVFGQNIWVMFFAGLCGWLVILADLYLIHRAKAQSP